MLPQVSVYGPYGANYGSHALKFDMDGITVWYSYKTPVAFEVEGSKLGRIVMKNYWSTTTGKHLNAIDGGDKKNRVTKEEFESLWRRYAEPKIKRAA